MTSSRATRRACAAALLALTLAGCASQAEQAGAPPSAFDGLGTRGCSSQRPAPSPIETAGATMYPTDTSLDEVAGQIQRAGDTRFADSYAGFEMVPEKGHAILYRVPDAEYDAFVQTTATAVCIELRDATFSQAELLKLVNRITDDGKEWRKAGIEINMVGPIHDGSGITVGTRQVERAKVELPKKYGARIPITFEEAGPITTW